MITRGTVFFLFSLFVLATLSRSVAAQEKPGFDQDLNPLQVSASERPRVSPPAKIQPAPALKRLIGRVYEGGLPIKGWKDWGGGLLVEPVWYHHYGRADGAQLVMIDWKLPRRKGTQQATFRVTDILFVPPLRKNQSLVFDCQARRRNVTRKIIAVVRTNRRNESEWWRDVRQAWSVSLDNGRVKPISPNGIKCVNEGWGH